jgi:chaperonin GroEL (HSP60 family)
VTAPDQQTLDELECVTAAAVRVLTHAMQAGAGSARSAWVVAGAGCTETYLADEVRKLVHGGSVMRGASGSTRRLVHRVMLNYADCLEQSCGMHPAYAEVVRQCRASESQNFEAENHGSGENLVHSYGWSGTDAFHVMALDSEADQPVLVADAHSVLDSLDAKLAALSTACDVANSLLRIDCSIEG